VNFSNYSRDSLMRKLARTDDTPAAGASQPQARPAPRKAPPPQSTASRCIVLKNMYNLAEYMLHPDSLLRY
jgi:RNA-binding protein 39